MLDKVKRLFRTNTLPVVEGVVTGDGRGRPPRHLWLVSSEGLTIRKKDGKEVRVYARAHELLPYEALGWKVGDTLRLECRGSVVEQGKDYYLFNNCLITIQSSA